MIWDEEKQEKRTHLLYIGNFEVGSKCLTRISQISNLQSCGWWRMVYDGCVRKAGNWG